MKQGSSHYPLSFSEIADDAFADHTYEVEIVLRISVKSGH
ncbi:MAG: hypothetical protein ACJASL_002463 [Paraglaciecola sp.]|jgi:hypothetical protein